MVPCDSSKILQNIFLVSVTVSFSSKILKDSDFPGYIVRVAAEGNEQSFASE